MKYSFVPIATMSSTHLSAHRFSIGLNIYEMRYYAKTRDIDNGQKMNGRAQVGVFPGQRFSTKHAPATCRWTSVCWTFVSLDSRAARFGYVI
jgi:hypothetical protein